MKVYVFPADRFGCGHYRLIWPSIALKNQGHDVVIVDPSARDGMMDGVMDGDTMIDVRIPEDADVMVFQRVTHKYIARAMELIRAKGVATVIDMDDDLSCIHPSNPAFNFMHPKGPYPLHSWHNTQLACESASMVVTATPALVERYAPHGRGRVFDNYVPSFMLDVEHKDSNIIGWPGSTHSHPDDLQVMGSSMSKLHRDGVVLANIGDGKGVREAWGLTEDVSLHVSGTVPIEQWGLAVTKLGIGVAPLADTRFNAAKSWLKMAEMAAVGVPCVASPRAEYTRLHEMGVGWLAKDHKDWYRKLKTLAFNDQARLELSEQGRDVMAGMTIEANSWKLAEIWAEASKLERGRGVRSAFGRHRHG